MKILGPQCSAAGAPKIGVSGQLQVLHYRLKVQDGEQTLGQFPKCTGPGDAKPIPLPPPVWP